MKSLLLSLLLLSLLAGYGFTENSPSEMTEIEILTELTNNLEAREKLLSQRETSLQMREENLQMREDFLTQKEESLIAIGNFSQSLRKELEKKRNSDYWRGFLHGSIVGFAAGNVSGGFVGFKIGINY